jgi:hypothetical protein
MGHWTPPVPPARAHLVVTARHVKPQVRDHDSWLRPALPLEQPYMEAVRWVAGPRPLLLQHAAEPAGLEAGHGGRMTGRWPRQERVADWRHPAPGVLPPRARPDPLPPPASGPLGCAFSLPAFDNLTLTFYGNSRSIYVVPMHDYIDYLS